MRLPHDPEGRQQGQGRRHGPRRARHLQGGRDVSGTRKRYLSSSATRRTRARSCSRARRQRRQNGVFVNGADQVTVDGFTARNYKANGFFVTQRRPATRSRNLSRSTTGVYGIYAFNTKGGVMADSEAVLPTTTRGFYIGQTPPQAKPIRSIVRDVTCLRQRDRLLRHEHALRDDHEVAFFNNATRHRPERAGLARSSRRRRTTSSPTTTSSGTTSTSTRARRSRCARDGDAALVPVGTGVLLLGGRAQPRRGQPHLRQLPGRRRGDRAASCSSKTPETRALHRQPVRDNRSALGGTDLNGRDIAYDGNGTDNCFGPNTGVDDDVARPTGAFPALPVRGRERFTTHGPQHDARLDRRQTR